jgi:hypothetical protein
VSQPSSESRSEPRDAQFADSSPPLSPVDEGALDAVVRATLESDEADVRVTPEEISALSDVARRHGPGPLTFEPAAVELVEAIIQVNYGQLRRPPEVWHATAVKIATLLFDSPTARARLENLWNRLIESHGSRTDA